MGHSLLDTSIPNVARMYDYMLGGRDNFQADRNAAESLLKVLPEVKQTVRDNRAFLCRVVRYLSERGIGQFLDVGSGLPAQENVHEVAHHATDPSTFRSVSDRASSKSHYSFTIYLVDVMRSGCYRTMYDD